jgi:hypothetical protein
MSALGDDDHAHGWSTTKVPVLTAPLAARQRSGPGLSATE